MPYFQMRMTPEQDRVLRKLAEQEHMTMSGLLKKLIYLRFEENKLVQIVKQAKIKAVVEK